MDKTIDNMKKQEKKETNLSENEDFYHTIMLIDWDRRTSMHFEHRFMEALEVHIMLEMKPHLKLLQLVLNGT